MKQLFERRKKGQRPQGHIYLTNYYPFHQSAEAKGLYSIYLSPSSDWDKLDFRGIKGLSVILRTGDPEDKAAGLTKKLFEADVRSLLWLHEDNGPSWVVPL